MADVLELKKEFAANAEKRKLDQSQFYSSMRVVEPLNGAVLGVRVLNRDDDVRNKNRNNLGLIRFAASGPASQDGTTNLQGMARWLSGHPEPDSEFGANYPLDGRAEIEFLVDSTDDQGNAAQVWKNAVTGEVNKEMIFLVDGRSTGNE